MELSARIGKSVHLEFCAHSICRLDRGCVKQNMLEAHQFEIESLYSTSDKFDFAYFKRATNTLRAHSWHIFEFN